MNDRATSIDAPAAMARSCRLDVSSANGRRYRIRMAWPSGDAPASGWPVIFVLDGDAYFGFVTDAVRNLSELGLEIAPAVIAAIGYADDDPDAWHVQRVLDYTPTPRAGATLPPALARLPHGGVDAFLDAIEHDIAREVARRRPIDMKAAALWGHSFGGLAVLHALFTRPTAFRSFLSVSPAIWFGDRALLAHEEGFVARLERERLDPRVHIAMGVREDEAPRRVPHGSTLTLDELIARVRDARMLVNARELAARLASHRGGPFYSVRYTELDGETHVSVPYAALRPALDMALPRGDEAGDV